MRVNLVYCLPTILQQLPSYNRCHHATYLKEYFNHLQTFDSYYLPSPAPANLLQLLPTICNTCGPFVVIAYHLQQHYLPCRLQISCPPLCCYLPMVTIILWQKVFSIPERKKKKKISYCYCRRNKNYYIKHNKTLCNLNAYYLPPLFNILQVE